MVNLTIKHSTAWYAPMPIWAENSSTGIRIRNDDVAPRPCILRFDSDEFMNDFLAIAQEKPERIADLIVQPETWRTPLGSVTLSKPGTDESSISFLLNKTKRLTDEKKPTKFKLNSKLRRSVNVSKNLESDEQPLKLFQAAHQRYYLVSASLIDKQPGFPDRDLNNGNHDRVSFVVRRLVPPENLKEPSLDNMAQWDEYAFVAIANGGLWKPVSKHGTASCKRLVSIEV